MSFQCCGQHLNGATRRWDYLGAVLAGGPVLGVQSPQVPHRGLEAVSLMECSGAARSGRQGTQIPKERLQVGTTCLCQRLQSAMISELARVLGGQVPRVGLLTLPPTPSADLVPRLFTGFSGQFTHKAQQNTA